MTPCSSAEFEFCQSLGQHLIGSSVLDFELLPLPLALACNGLIFIVIIISKELSILYSFINAVATAWSGYTFLSPYSKLSLLSLTMRFPHS